MSQPSNAGSAGQQVIDEADITQNSVLQRIQKARDDIAQVKAQRINDALEGSSNGWAFRRAYYRAVDALCGEIQPYLRNDDFPLATQFWEEEPIGAITFEPPKIVQKPSKSKMDSVIKQGGKKLSMTLPRNSVTSTSYPVQGLRDFNNADEVMAESWQVMFGPEVSASDLRERNSEQGVQIDPRDSKQEPFTVYRYKPLPTSIIQRAEALCVEFAYELGMDIEFEYEDYESEEPLV